MEELMDSVNGPTTNRQGAPGKFNLKIKPFQPGWLLVGNCPLWLSYVLAVVVTVAAMLVRMEMKVDFGEELFSASFSFRSL